MNYQDYLAWSILAVFYLIGVIPVVGSWVTGFGSIYKDDWKVGAIMHLVLGGFAVVVLGVLWAFIRVFGEVA